MKKIVTFGEIMLRLQTPGYKRFKQAQELELRFGGGLIYALLSDYSMQDTIEFAVAASCLKHTIEGDFNLMSVGEVTALAGGDGSGRVQR